MQDYGLEDLRNKVGYIPQKAVLFSEMSRAISTLVRVQKPAKRDCYG